MDHLAETRVPLEISPSSNVRTGVIARLADLPLATFRERGVCFSINSDDPPLFATDLTREYAIAIHLLGLDRTGTAALVADAIDQSFAPPGIRQRLLNELIAHTPAVEDYLANGATASISSR